MDPISITAGVLGVLSSVVTIALKLQALKDQYENVPSSVHTVLYEVQSMKALFSQLRALLEHDSDDVDAGYRGRDSMVTVEQLCIPIMGCICTCSELEKEVDAIIGATHVPPVKIQRWNHIQWMNREQAIQKILQNLNAHKITLTLVFSILTRKSEQKALQDSNQLQSTLEELRLQNQGLFDRLQGMDTQLEQLTRDPGRASINYNRSSRHPMNPRDETESETTSIRTVRQLSRAGAIRSVVGRGFERVLLEAAVYRRANLRPRDSFASLRSKTSNWSMLSELTLDMVSKVSVISLPVSSAELHNGEHYLPDSLTIVSLQEGPKTPDSILEEIPSISELDAVETAVEKTQLGGNSITQYGLKEFWDAVEPVYNIICELDMGRQVPTNDSLTNYPEIIIFNPVHNTPLYSLKINSFSNYRSSADLVLTRRNLLVPSLPPVLTVCTTVIKPRPTTWEIPGFLESRRLVADLVPKRNFDTILPEPEYEKQKGEQFRLCYDSSRHRYELYPRVSRSDYSGVFATISPSPDGARFLTPFEPKGTIHCWAQRDGEKLCSLYCWENKKALILSPVAAMKLPTVNAVAMDIIVAAVMAVAYVEDRKHYL